MFGGLFGLAICYWLVGLFVVGLIGIGVYILVGWGPRAKAVRLKLSKSGLIHILG